MQCVKLFAAVNLEPEMIDTGGTAALRDREIQARLVEHPLRVVVLAHGRLAAEQRRIEPNARGEIGDRDVDVESFHAPLHFDRATHSVDDARELDEQAVAGRLDDATLVLGDLRVDQLTPVRLERGERAALVVAHAADRTPHGTPIELRPDDFGR